MQSAATTHHEEERDVPESPQMRQYLWLRGKAINRLEAQQRQEAETSISRALSLDQSDTKPSRPAYLKLATPQTEIDYIRSLADKDEAERLAWMDRYISDEVSNVMDRLAKNQVVSNSVAGEALVAGLVNPAYIPHGKLGPVFAAMAQRYNRPNFFKYCVIDAIRNGLISPKLTAQQAEVALWDIYNTIAVL